MSSVRKDRVEDFIFELPRFLRQRNCSLQRRRGGAASREGGSREERRGAGALLAASLVAGWGIRAFPGPFLRG